MDGEGSRSKRSRSRSKSHLYPDQHDEHEPDPDRTMVVENDENPLIGPSRSSKGKERAYEAEDHQPEQLKKIPLAFRVCFQGIVSQSNEHRASAYCAFMILCHLEERPNLKLLFTPKKLARVDKEENELVFKEVMEGLGLETSDFELAKRMVRHFTFLKCVRCLNINISERPEGPDAWTLIVRDIFEKLRRLYAAMESESQDTKLNCGKLRDLFGRFSKLNTKPRLHEFEIMKYEEFIHRLKNAHGDYESLKERLKRQQARREVKIAIKVLTRTTNITEEYRHHFDKVLDFYSRNTETGAGFRCDVGSSGDNDNDDSATEYHRSESMSEDEWISAEENVVSDESPSNNVDSEESMGGNGQGVNDGDRTMVNESGGSNSAASSLLNVLRTRPRKKQKVISNSEDEGDVPINHVAPRVSMRAGRQEGNEDENVNMGDDGVLGDLDSTPSRDRASRFLASSSSSQQSGGSSSGVGFGRPATNGDSSSPSTSRSQLRQRRISTSDGPDEPSVDDDDEEQVATENEVDESSED
ncbi:hypothetical protein HDU76_008332, partial [Blyttiomyces sp. JEL0837]